MATIRENQKDGKIVSFRFISCLERDASGKQVRRYTTWTPPEGLAPTKARKAADRAAEAWENEVRAEYQKEKEAKAQGRAYMLPPEKRHDDFVSFVNNNWLALQIKGGNVKPSTASFYEYMTKPIIDYFQSAVLQEISPADIQRYFIYLRTEHKSKIGKVLSPKSIRHQYVTLNVIFEYAEKQEMIARNPMEKVDAPKKDKKPVDALTKEQAEQFFSLLPSCALDFRCILQLLVTTGLRRGECIGLKWGDIDETTCAICVERNVTYTPQGGIAVSTPKTSNGIRTIPIMSTTLQLLQQLKRQMQQQNPGTILESAFLFLKDGDIFQPRDPSSITRRVKRFMKNNGLPDLSPHDLRHPNVKPKTNIVQLFSEYRVSTCSTNGDTVFCPLPQLEAAQNQAYKCCLLQILFLRPVTLHNFFLD